MRSSSRTHQRRHTTRYTVDIPLDPEAPGIARRVVAQVAATHPEIDDILLATSEVVTNAVRHSPDGVDSARLAVVESDANVRVSIAHIGHVGSGFIPGEVPQHLAATGRGLAIVAGVADTWGVAAVGGNVEVWFEVGTQAETAEDPQATSFRPRTRGNRRRVCE